MKGIILSAGKGTRLYPMTIPVCKSLLPVYDKPLIYYSLATLMEAGINEILIIVPPTRKQQFIDLLGDGSNLGIHLEYKTQETPKGIADAFIIGKKFIGNDKVCLILGDNIFYGDHFNEKLSRAVDLDKGANVFGLWVNDPRAFGVVEFDNDGKAISIEEKPKKPKSNYIIPGLYFYDNSVVDIASYLKPSARGELEITDVNKEYLKREDLRVIELGEQLTWFDAGTEESLLIASNNIYKRQKKGKYIACIEEIAWKKGYIDKNQLRELGEALNKTKYGQYLLSCLK